MSSPSEATDAATEAVDVALAREEHEKAALLRRHGGKARS